MGVCYIDLEFDMATVFQIFVLFLFLKFERTSMFFKF